MEPSSACNLKRLRFPFLLFLFLTHYSISSVQSLCHDDERSALLQFRQSFVVGNLSTFRYYDDNAYPKTQSWNKEDDCCSWDGVDCDGFTGHVVGLDLSYSFLYGSINSDNSLFKLVHLQRLNLAYNDFNYSKIPSGLTNLSRLTHLNLSSTMISGQIPSELSLLSKLSSLDLSFNLDPVQIKLLQLKEPNLGSLLENLTNLEVLSLSSVNIDSTVPDILTRISSLRRLSLKDCGLYGESPVGILQLPHLEFVCLASNENLAGYLPEFSKNNSLNSLMLEETEFSGEIPSSIGNLVSLKSLSIQDCKFEGPIPPSLGNLTNLTFLNLANNSLHGLVPTSLSNLAQLLLLDLSSNQLSGLIPSSFGKLSRLEFFHLSRNAFEGQIPSLSNLTQLSVFAVSNNQITGPVPAWLTNLTRLIVLDLSSNGFVGTIPSSISQLQNLESLNLYSNKLRGEVDLSMFLQFQRLTVLFLSYNRLSLLTQTPSNATTHQRLQIVALGSCNLTTFPDFLRYQDELEWLDLPYNKIGGQIPTWIWNASRESMKYVVLSNNFLTGFEGNPTNLPWLSLIILDMRFNMLQGSLPIPQPSTKIYEVSNNRLTNEIPASICSLESLYTLDLSFNNLSGNLPFCLRNLSNSLSVLNLQSNRFSGIPPQSCSNRSELRMMDLSHNSFHCELPKSMVTCTMLEYIDFSNNQITGTFPFWLGSLPQLKVLVLRFNRFQGAINVNPERNYRFPKLRIIDLSHNQFSGKLPSEYLKNWNAMKVVDKSKLKYMQTENYTMSGLGNWLGFDYSLSLTNKGIETLYAKISESLAVIDLSSNNFVGEIPAIIGNLKALISLNLSNNILTGEIPSSIGNLTELESLDISRNKISGEIPTQLTQLNFLAVFDVSHNFLTGPIPKGKQFDTFQAKYFEGNSGLCGTQLPKKCGKSETSTVPASTIEEDEESGFPFSRIAVLIGYGCGFLAGAVFGSAFNIKKHVWFVKTRR